MNFLYKWSVWEAVSFARLGLGIGWGREANSFPYNGSVLARYSEAAAPGIQLLRKMGKETIRRALDENLDLPRATESSARIQAHQRRFTRSQNFTCSQRYFLFQAPCAQRADHVAIFANHHSRTRPPITRAFYMHQSRERV
jgi:hypothetical protein